MSYGNLEPTRMEMIGATEVTPFDPEKYAQIERVVLRYVKPNPFERSVDALSFYAPAVPLATITAVSVLAISGCSELPSSKISSNVGAGAKSQTTTQIIHSISPHDNSDALSLFNNSADVGKPAMTIPKDKSPALSRLSKARINAPKAKISEAPSLGTLHTNNTVTGSQDLLSTKLSPGETIWNIDEMLELSGRAPYNIIKEVALTEKNNGIDRLAKLHHQSIEAIAQDLPIGDNIISPVISNAKEAAHQSSTDNSNDLSSTHIAIVHKGDTLSGIAHSNDETLPELIKQNPTVGLDPRDLQINQKIIVGTSYDNAKDKAVTSTKSTTKSVGISSNKSISGTNTNSGGAGISVSQPTPFQPKPSKRATLSKTSSIIKTTAPAAGAAPISGTAPITEAGHSRIIPHSVVNFGSTEKTGSLMKTEKRDTEKAHAAEYDRKHVYKKDHESHISAELSLKRIRVSKRFCDSRLVGHSTEQRIFNYIVVCEGLDKSQAAGQDGNEIWESRGDATIVQGGSFSLRPTTTPGLGWGVDQSTPGIKMVYAKDDYHVKGNIDKLITQQNIIRMQMHGTSPTQNSDMIKDMEQTNTPQEAAELFEAEFEEGPIAYEGGGSLSKRQALAVDIDAQFKDTSPLKQYKEAIRKRRLHELRHVAGAAKIVTVATTKSTSHSVHTSHREHKIKINEHKIELHRLNHKHNTQSSLRDRIIREAIFLAWKAPIGLPNPTRQYQVAMKRYNPSAPLDGESCDALVSTVYRATGIDPNYPSTNTGAQMQYVLEHPNKYKIITNRVTSMSQLVPGATLIINPNTLFTTRGIARVGSGMGHTFIWLGGKGPHGYNASSASYEQHSDELETYTSSDILNDPRGYYTEFEPRAHVAHVIRRGIGGGVSIVNNPGGPSNHTADHHKSHKLESHDHHKLHLEDHKHHFQKIRHDHKHADRLQHKEHDHVKPSSTVQHIKVVRVKKQSDKHLILGVGSIKKLSTIPWHNKIRLSTSKPIAYPHRITSTHSHTAHKKTRK
jgi:hypothetical protein